jgi:hypothetical protein
MNFSYDQNNKAPTGETSLDARLPAPLPESNFKEHNAQRVPVLKRKFLPCFSWLYKKEDSSLKSICCESRQPRDQFLCSAATT